MLLGLVACHKPQPYADSAEPMAASDDRIECATAGAEFSRDCTVERTTTQAGLVLTLRHPDGHFRRLAVTHDGRGVVAADGAEPARVKALSSGEIEVALGGDRYRLPATVKPGAKAP